MDTTALVLVIIAALNWGALGLFGVDFISPMFGGDFTVASRIVYAIIGLGGLWAITLLFRENERSPIADTTNNYNHHDKR